MTQAEIATPEGGKAGLRRAQVLDAAMKRFGMKGFHGASMADIAAEAGMSVGHIYRYFENKEAIVAAIVERDMREAMERMAAVRARQGDIVEELIALVSYKMEHLSNPERAALTLEILAEAARNPRVADIVRCADGDGRSCLREVLTRRGAVDEQCLVSRMDMIAMLIEGWVIRAVKNPNVDKAAYLDALRAMFRVLITEGPAPSCGAQSTNSTGNV